MIEPTLCFNPVIQRRMHFVKYASDGLPIYTDLLQAIADVCKARVKTHHQNTIGIIGRTSSGKSTLAVNLSYLIDDFFHVKGNYLITKEDLAKKLKKPLDSVSPVNLFDEGSIILNSANHATKDSTNLTTLFDIMRSWEMTSLFCVPKLRTLNNRIRNDHIDLILVCGKAPFRGYDPRAFFLAHIRTESSVFSEAVYWMPFAWGFSPVSMPTHLEAEYLPLKKATQDRYRQQLVEQYLSDDNDDLMAMV